MDSLKYRAEHAKEILEYQKEYNIKHSKDVLEYQKKYNKKYYNNRKILKEPMDKDFYLLLKNCEIIFNLDSYKRFKPIKDKIIIQLYFL